MSELVNDCEVAQTLVKGRKTKTYYVVSSTIRFGLNETAIFAANESGKILDFIPYYLIVPIDHKKGEKIAREEQFK